MDLSDALGEGYSRLTVRALHRRAREICTLLGVGWVYLVQVRAGNRSSRVVFANLNKRDRIVLEESGRLAVVRVSDVVLQRRLSGILRRRTNGAA